MPRTIPLAALMRRAQIWLQPEHLDLRSCRLHSNPQPFQQLIDGHVACARFDRWRAQTLLKLTQAANDEGTAPAAA